MLIPQPIEITPNSSIQDTNGCSEAENKFQQVDSYTKKYQEHKICSYAYKVVCCVDEQYTKPIKIYKGENAAYKFIEDILQEEKKIQKIFKRKFNKPLEMSSEDTKDFQESDKCWICDKQILKMIFELEIMIMLPENIEDQLIKYVI